MDLIVSLREAVKADAAVIANYAGDYEVARMVATIPHPYSLQDAYDFIDIISAQQKLGQGHSLIIARNDQITGMIGWFYNDENMLEIGYWVARKFWGQGIAGKAVQLIIDLIRIECPDDTHVLAQYMNENPASGRVLEKNGFVSDGGGDVCFSLARGEARPATRMIKKL